MSDWGPWAGDSHVSSSLFSPTPDTTAHTKSAWETELGGVGDATQRSDGVYLQVPYLQHITSIRTLLVDVAIGSPEQVIISNLMLCPPTAGLTTCRAIAQTIYFPLALPPGVTSIRSQASVAAHGVFTLNVTKMKSGLPAAGTVVDTYGADTANTRGTVVTAPASEGVFGAWAEVTASSERVKCLMVALGNGNQDWTTHSNQWYALEIAIGGAGSEQEIVHILEAGGSSSGTGTVSQMVLGPYFVDVPKGSRLSARVSKQYATDQRTIDVVLYGIR